MESKPIKVYIKIDNNKCINEINSEMFISDTTDFIKIDEGYGDKYHHAQNHYLKNGLFDDKFRLNYKYENSKVIELTEKEKDILFPVIPEPPTEVEILKSNVEYLNILNDDLVIKTAEQQSEIEYLKIIVEV